MGDVRNIYRILVGKLERIGTLGMRRCRWTETNRKGGCGVRLISSG